MVAVSQVFVNHDERSGSAPDALVCDQGSSLLGPPGFLRMPWVQVHGGCITGALCKLFAFFGETWHWLVNSDIGHSRISHLVVTGYLVKRLQDPTCVLIAKFILFLCLFQKDWKFGRGVASSVAWLGLWESSLGWVGSDFAQLVVTCPGLGMSAGNNVHMGLLLGLWKVVTTNGSGRYVDFGISCWCSCGAFGWNSQAPPLHQPFSKRVHLVCSLAW